MIYAGSTKQSSNDEAVNHIPLAGYLSYFVPNFSLLFRLIACRCFMQNKFVYGCFDIQSVLTCTHVLAKNTARPLT
jgi:hypothetical protein